MICDYVFMIIQMKKNADFLTSRWKNKFHGSLEERDNTKKQTVTVKK